MIYIGNIAITTAKSATYLGNAGSNQSVVDQAFRQQRIAQQTGRTVEWHVPDQAAATRVQNAFATAPQSQRIDPNVVRIVVTPQ